MKEYYVYMYYVVDTNEVFYIGKGKGNRAYTGKRNKFCEDMKNTHNWAVKILDEGLSESESFELEMEYIKEFREGNRLTNQTDGGDGTSGYIMTDEAKKKISKSSIKKWEDEDYYNLQMYHRKHGVYSSKEFSEKISSLTTGELNGNYGNKWTDEMKKSLSEKKIEGGLHKGVKNGRATKIRCVETGEVFDYIRLACEKYGIKNQASITFALNNPNRTAYGFHWERVE